MSILSAIERLQNARKRSSKAREDWRHGPSPVTGREDAKAEKELHAAEHELAQILVPEEEDDGADA